MAQHTANPEDHGHGHGEYHSHKQLYIKIWAALLVLLLISILGPMLEIWWLTLITAFGIAFVKASMVIKFFMHLDHEPKFIWYILTISLAFMLLFFFAVAPDVKNHEGSNWVNYSAAAAIERGMAYGDPASHHGEHGGDHGAPHAEEHGEDHGGEHHEDGAGEHGEAAGGH